MHKVLLIMVNTVISLSLICKELEVISKDLSKIVKLAKVIPDSHVRTEFNDMKGRVLRL